MDGDLINNILALTNKLNTSITILAKYGRELADAKKEGQLNIFEALDEVNN
jgi:hypothetical protein